MPGETVSGKIILDTLKEKQVRGELLWLCNAIEPSNAPRSEESSSAFNYVVHT